MAVTVFPSTRSLLHTRAHRFTTLWGIYRTDGVNFFFTDHDQDVSFEGRIYTPTDGITASSRQKQSGLRPSNFEARGVLFDATLSDDDFRSGKFRDARVTEIVADWQYPFAGAFFRATYWIESVNFNGELWEAQISSQHNRFASPIGLLYGRTCRYTFGDVKCALATTDFDDSSTVTGVPEVTRVFGATGLTSQSDTYYAYGLITWTSGSNIGIEVEVDTYIDATRLFALRIPMPFNIEVGDGFTVVAGCDKLLATCRDKFDNVVNFGGFPTIPGTDAIAAGYTSSGATSKKKN